LDGTTDGSYVGLLDGTTDGSYVGLYVGSFDGIYDGVHVGSKLCVGSWVTTLSISIQRRSRRNAIDSSII
jgi:hypothetical protein